MRNQAFIRSTFIVAVLSIPVLGTGCALGSRLRFQVVDAKSGKPLEGVKVTEHRMDLSFFGPYADDYGFGFTSGSCIVDAGRAVASRERVILFDRTGYLRSAVLGGGTGATVSVISPVEGKTVGKLGEDVDVSGIIRVPMHQRGDESSGSK